jgi:hypothetical protein
MKFNLYIANHGKRDGVEDYLAILGDIIARRGHELVVAEHLDPDHVNIVIDEFTNFICNDEIATFRRQYPHAKLIFVLTEFIESRLLVRSFNFFGGLLEAAPVAAMNVYLRLRRKDFLPPSFNAWLIAAAYSPLLVVYYLLHCLKNWRSGKHLGIQARLYRRAYMLMRYLGLEKMIGCADAVVLSHAMIEPGLRKLSPAVPVLGTVFPELDFGTIKNTLFSGKRLYIETTGSVTPYRQKYIDKINSDLVVLGMKNMFYLCRAISFGGPVIEPAPSGMVARQNETLSAQSWARTERRVLRGAYSLHPPQSRRWKYSSPTRIFRALRFDHNMPVLTKLFGQHPIEHLCLVFSGRETLAQMYRYYKNPEALFAHLEPRLDEYMHIAIEANDAVVASMVGMARGGEDDNSVCR